MKPSTTERLGLLGLDTEFLRWLEGEGDRLPRLDAVRRVPPKDFLAAVRAVTWLRQLFAQPKAVAPQSAKEWNSRYHLLEEFLWCSIRWSGTYYILNKQADLAALERVLERLLPESSWKLYRADVLDLRRKGYPQSFPAGPTSRGPRKGGKKTSEQTERMRAAVAYVKTVSDRPYADLANFWNESTEHNRAIYQPDEIVGRLRKGKLLERRQEIGEGLLKFWKVIYYENLWAVFPGPWPLSSELLEVYQRRWPTGERRPEPA